MDTDTTDAWIWAAIAMASGSRLEPVDWSEVIGAADAINKAIPRDDEIEHAVNRLATAGLLTVEGESVIASDEALDLFEIARQNARDGMFDVANQLGKVLPPEPASGPWRLAPGTTKRAYWTYTRKRRGWLDGQRSGNTTGNDQAYELVVLRRARTFNPAVLSYFRIADDEADEPDQQAWFESIGRTIRQLAGRNWIAVGECRPSSHPKIERRLGLNEIEAIFGEGRNWWDYETPDQWIGIECTAQGIEALNELTPA